MNWELLAYLTLAGIIAVAGVMALKGFGGGFRDGGVILVNERRRPGEHLKSPRSWHGRHYVDDTTGRVIGTVRRYGDLWRATGDRTAVFIDEASARRAVESCYWVKEALR